MRLTPALYVRQLLAKLHPPLPQTPRESKQLLNLLGTSFRKHLDEVHPAPEVREDVTEAPYHHHIPLSSSSNVAHHHLMSVLMHPLLDKQTGPNIRNKTLAGDAVRKFDEALVNGGVTIDTLAKCVKQYATGIGNGEQIMESQMLGQRVASWLYTAPPSVKKDFFTASDLIFHVIPIIAADKQETTIWEWLRVVYERDFGGQPDKSSSLSDIKWLRAEDNIVSSLMRLSIRRKDLNDAAQQFVEACRYRQESGRATVSRSGTSGQLPYAPMSSSWKRLAAAIVQSRGSHGIETELFETAMRSGLSWSNAPHYSEAVLAIYHPKNPSSQILCQKLRHAESAAVFLDSRRISSKVMRKAMLVALLDGAQLSLDQHLRQDARFLLEFASAHYPEFLPSTQLQNKQSIEAQLRSVQEALQISESGTYRLALT